MATQCINQLQLTAEVVLPSAASAQWDLGVSKSNAGDINGDDFDDLIV